MRTAEPRMQRVQERLEPGAPVFHDRDRAGQSRAFPGLEVFAQRGELGGQLAQRTHGRLLSGGRMPRAWRSGFSSKCVGSSSTITNMISATRSPLARSHGFCRALYVI